jgi:hypothetical protein
VTPGHRAPGPHPARGPPAGRSKGWGIVEFETPEEVRTSSAPGPSRATCALAHRWDPPWARPGLRAPGAAGSPPQPGTRSGLPAPPRSRGREAPGLRRWLIIGRARAARAAAPPGAPAALAASSWRQERMPSAAGCRTSVAGGRSVPAGDSARRFLRSGPRRQAPGVAVSGTEQNACARRRAAGAAAPGPRHAWHRAQMAECTDAWHRAQPEPEIRGCLTPSPCPAARRPCMPCRR